MAGFTLVGHSHWVYTWYSGYLNWEHYRLENSARNVFQHRQQRRIILSARHRFTKTKLIYLMDMKRVYLAFCIVMVSTLVSIASSCDSSMEGYRAFTLHAGNASFHIEYPASYQKPGVDRTAEPYITLVDILHVT